MPRIFTENLLSPLRGQCLQSLGLLSSCVESPKSWSPRKEQAAARQTGSSECSYIPTNDNVRRLGLTEMALALELRKPCLVTVVE